MIDQSPLGDSELQDEGDEAVGVDDSLPMPAHATGAHGRLDRHAGEDVLQNLLAQAPPIHRGDGEGLLRWSRLGGVKLVRDSHLKNVFVHFGEGKNEAANEAIVEIE